MSTSRNLWTLLWTTSWRPVHIIQVNWLSVLAPYHAIKACEEMARSAFKGRKERPQHSEEGLCNFALVKENTRSHFTGAKEVTHTCAVAVPLPPYFTSAGAEVAIFNVGFFGPLGMQGAAATLGHH